MGVITREYKHNLMLFSPKNTTYITQQKKCSQSNHCNTHNQNKLPKQSSSKQNEYLSSKFSIRGLNLRQGCIATQIQNRIVISSTTWNSSNNSSKATTLIIRRCKWTIRVFRKPNKGRKRRIEESDRFRWGMRWIEVVVRG